MKTDRELVHASIEHWKRMVERCKWLAESGLCCDWESFLDETPYVEDCPLCSKYISDNEFCDCNLSWKWTPWMFAVLNDGVEGFIINAEKYMIPALYECFKFCKDE